jgi:hypothetical protein
VRRRAELDKRRVFCFRVDGDAQPFGEMLYLIELNSSCVSRVDLF